MKRGRFSSGKLRLYVTNWTLLIIVRILNMWSVDDMSTPVTLQCSSSFTEFDLLGIDSVRKLVLGAPTKSCPLDPIPTRLVKECLEELLPVLTDISGSALSFGDFPDEWKEVLIIPLLKRMHGLGSGIQKRSSNQQFTIRV